MKRITFGAPLGALLACYPVAAQADHMGASGFGGGGGISVFGPDTLDGRQWAAGFRLAYTRPVQRSDAALEALAGAHVHAHNAADNLNASLGLAYGLSHHLTISAELPYVRRDKLREGAHSHSAGQPINSVEELGSVAGVGDLNLLAKYRLTEGDETGLALIGGLKMPTGGTHERSLDGERLETEHQPGTGSWDPIVGASASTRAGAIRLTASALLQISTRGAQRTRLGNRLQGGIALSHRFGAQGHDHVASLNHHYHDEIDEHRDRPHDSWDAFIEVAGEWEGRERVGGTVEDASGGKWAWVAPGVRFNAAAGWSLSAGVAVPVWQRIRLSHPENHYRLTVAMGHAF